MITKENDKKDKLVDGIKDLMDELEATKIKMEKIDEMFFLILECF